MARQNHGAHICSFDAVDIRKGDLNDYDAFKHKVLLAGRFSVFEATETQRRAKLFDRLCRDPEIVTETVGFPWTLVKLNPDLVAPTPNHDAGGGK